MTDGRTGTGYQNRRCLSIALRLNHALAQLPAGQVLQEEIPRRAPAQRQVQLSPGIEGGEPSHFAGKPLGIDLFDFVVAQPLQIIVAGIHLPGDVLYLFRAEMLCL